MARDFQERQYYTEWFREMIRVLPKVLNAIDTAQQPRQRAWLVMADQRQVLKPGKASLIWTEIVPTMPAIVEKDDDDRMRVVGFDQRTLRLNNKKKEIYNSLRERFPRMPIT